jgi:hypothetical protein
MVYNKEFPLSTVNTVGNVHSITFLVCLPESNIYNVAGSVRNIWPLHEQGVWWLSGRMMMLSQMISLHACKPGWGFPIHQVTKVAWGFLIQALLHAEIYWSFYEKCPLLSDFKQNSNVSTDFSKISDYKIS